MSRVDALAQRLRRTPTRALPPLRRADAPATSLFHAPEWSPLRGTPCETALEPRARRELSRHEAAAFFSANVHAERRFVAAITRRLARGDVAHADYLRHVAFEETAHAQLFEEACVAWLGGLHPDRTIVLNAPAREPLEEDLVLHGQLLIFEEIADAHDVAHARDERIAPCVREIHAAHHADEARHLAFGRALLRELWERGRCELPPSSLARVARDLAVAWGTCWRAIATSEPARRAGLRDPAGARELAWRSAAFARLRARVLAQRLTGLLESGLLPQDMTP